MRQGDVVDVKWVGIAVTWRPCHRVDERRRFQLAILTMVRPLFLP